MCTRCRSAVTAWSSWVRIMNWPGHADARRSLPVVPSPRSPDGAQPRPGSAAYPSVWPICLLHVGHRGDPGDWRYCGVRIAKAGVDPEVAHMGRHRAGCRHPDLDRSRHDRRRRRGPGSGRGGRICAVGQSQQSRHLLSAGAGRAVSPCGVAAPIPFGPRPDHHVVLRAAIGAWRRRRKWCQAHRVHRIRFGVDLLVSGAPGDVGAKRVSGLFRRLCH